MSISLIRFIPAAIFIIAGVVIMALQTFGIFKIRYALNRMHSAAMGDSLGIFLLVIGLAIIYGFSMPTLKLLSIIVLFWFASPVCSHLLANLEVFTNDKITEECEVPDDDVF